MEVGYDGKVLRGEGEVEASAFCIHAPIHRPDPETRLRPAHPHAVRQRRSPPR